MNQASDKKGDFSLDALAKLGEWILKGGATLEAFQDEVIDEIDAKLSRIEESVGKEGIDPFGMDPQMVRRIAVGAAFIYNVYFRCHTVGLENIPSGPSILVANHGGQIPIDGLMITTAVLLEGDPPRLARVLVDRWVPTIPFVSTVLSRVGVSVGTPENAQRLLKRGEILLSFPEGMTGITKTVEQAYQLQEFGLGFMRLALATNTPIVPVAVVGSEEQYPTLYSLPSLGKIVGLPTVPIWIQMVIPVIGLLPLPVKYRLAFGEPIHVQGDPDDENAAIQEMVDDTKAKLNQMIGTLRSERKSIFF